MKTIQTRFTGSCRWNWRTEFSSNPTRPAGAQKTDMKNESNNLPYVVITPCRNEARFIEETLKSVGSQTILPLKGVIVNDGSTDATEEIVAKYAAQYSWIELINRPARKERHFAAKV